MLFELATSWYFRFIIRQKFDPKNVVISLATINIISCGYPGSKEKCSFLKYFLPHCQREKKFSLETNILFPSSSGSVHSSEWYGDGELCKIGQQAFQAKANNTDLLFVANPNKDDHLPSIQYCLLVFSSSSLSPRMLHCLVSNPSDLWPPFVWTCFHEGGIKNLDPKSRFVLRKNMTLPEAKRPISVVHKFWIVFRF